MSKAKSRCQFELYWQKERASGLYYIAKENKIMNAQNEPVNWPNYQEFGQSTGQSDDERKLK